MRSCGGPPSVSLYKSSRVLSRRAAAHTGAATGRTDQGHTGKKLWAIWKGNSGEVRLEILKPHLDNIEESPLLARSVVNDGRELSRDRRQVARPDRGRRPAGGGKQRNRETQSCRQQPANTHDSRCECPKWHIDHGRRQLVG